MAGLPPVAIAAVVVLLVAGGLETVRPWRPVGATTGRRWVANLCLYGLCFGLAYVVAPLVTALVAAANLHLGLVEHLPGPAARLIVVVLVLDLLEYALHRASHALPLLWRLHQPHHSDLELDVTTTLRHHPFEAALMAVAIGGSGALLGFTLDEIACYGALALGVQMLAHANIAVPAALNRLLAPVLVIPDFHRVHHSRARRDADANYGQVFALWDTLFRSRRSPDMDLIEFGLDDCRDAAAQTLPRLLAQPMLRAGSAAP